MTGCQYPDLRATSGYRKGCRCTRCRTGHRDDARDRRIRARHRHTVREDLLGTFRKLNLRVAGDGATITIDLSALAGKYGVRSMLVERDGPDSDVWHHYPSGVAGPLSEVLIGIAWTYVRFPEDAA